MDWQTWVVLVALSGAVAFLVWRNTSRRRKPTACANCMANNKLYLTKQGQRKD